MGQLDGKVAFITGAARGQGRSHAVLLAQEGADIIGLDICEQVPTVASPMSRQKDLDETVALVEKTGRRMIGVKGDVRNRADIQRALDLGLAEFGRLDIVLANAGIYAVGLKPYDKSEQAWQDSLDIILTGTWNTLQLTAPILVEQGQGGAIVITSSTVGVRWVTTNYDGGFDGYSAAKYGQVGMMTAYAGRLAEYNIRVNTLHPGPINTPMVANEHFAKWGEENGPLIASFASALPVTSMEPVEMSKVVLFLVSDTGRYVTGQKVVVDAGQTSVPPAGGGTLMKHPSDG
ncbi:mycofactocin-coupled SDR family oxidoreductase [Amycolatopsis pithecellobii]|uniref:Mycofactocin-coupled SDR family oxidoreductase n=1 Tax=Amycolatopsis pithecellobii TaxID=664692 RepID=A0A6N7ZBH9_9PSEU|nr:mycofactocin-coupled SDR family oxidoreductase [Amycolatopsis pithecellobii]MTD59116.1 mycofactocin-coupled SDR family oxidoreductase [Amycolatopsis pithecellobii]